MKIKYIKHSEIDFLKWDACIQSALNSLVYAESWYLDIVSPNWEALISENYEYVMPLTPKQKFGIPYVMQPPLTQQLGVFSDKIISREIIECFIQKIPYQSYDLNLNEQNTCDKGITQPNFVLNLNRDYETISSEFSKNTKRNIEKARRATVRISKNITPECFLEFFFTNSVNANYPTPKEELVSLLIQTACKEEKLLLYGAFSPEDKLIAILGMLKTKKRLIYLLPMSDADGKKFSAMALIINDIIQDYSGSDCDLDFSGSKNEGIARFYKGFGAKQRNYIQIQQKSIATAMSLLKKLRSGAVS